MVDKKTGGLFRMLTRLMVAESPVSEKVSDDDLSLLSCLLGRFFQIRSATTTRTSLRLTTLRRKALPKTSMKESTPSH